MRARKKYRGKINESCCLLSCLLIEKKIILIISSVLTSCFHSNFFECILEVEPPQPYLAIKGVKTRSQQDGDGKLRCRALQQHLTDKSRQHCWRAFILRCFRGS